MKHTLNALAARCYHAAEMGPLPGEAPNGRRGGRWHGAGWRGRAAALAVAGLSWGLMLSPALPYLITLPHFGRLPSNDYYMILEQVTDERGFSRDPLAWLAVRSNEHSVALPALVFALNVGLTRGDNRGLSAAALLLLFAVFALLYGLLPRDLRQAPLPGTGLGVALATLVFTPVAAHNVVMGFSGTVWFMANAFAVAAVAALARAAGDGRARWPWAAVLLGGLGALTFSTGLLLWPALLAGALLLGLPRRHLALIAAAATAIAFLYLLSYRPVPTHPAPTVDPATLALHVSILLGSLFTARGEVALSIGAGGLALSGLLAAGLLRGSREACRLAAPWLMLQVYAVGSGLAAAVARSGFDEEGIFLSSRYASLPALFWAACLAMVALWGRDRPWRPAARAALCGALAVGLAVPMYWQGIPELRWWLDRAAHQPVAELALVHGIPDEAALGYVSPAPEQVIALSGLLRRWGHVPFDRPPEEPAQELIDPGLLAPRRPEGLRGAFESIHRLDVPRIARVSGWAWSPETRVVEVVVMDEAGRAPRGMVVTGLPRPDLARRVRAPTRASGWWGYVELVPPPKRLTAYARLSGDARLWPLGTRPVPPPP